MDYSGFGIPWNECRTRLQPQDMQRLERFVMLNQRCGGTKDNFWCVEEYGQITDVLIFDFIGDTDRLCERILQVKAACINVRLNSTGGNALEMFKVLNTLSSLVDHKTITTVVSGLAASASAVLAAAGERAYICEDAFYAIHNGYPDKGKPETTDKDQEGFNLYIASIFQIRTGIPIEQLQAWMDQDTLFNPQEALALGFVDEIIAPDPLFTDDAHRARIEKAKPKLAGGVWGV